MVLRKIYSSVLPWHGLFPETTTREGVHFHWICAIQCGLCYPKRSLMSWVVVIPKARRAHRAAPVLLLVWHRLFRFLFLKKKNLNFFLTLTQDIRDLFVWHSPCAIQCKLLLCSEWEMCNFLFVKLVLLLFKVSGEDGGNSGNYFNFTDSLYQLEALYKCSLLNLKARCCNNVRPNGPYLYMHRKMYRWKPARYLQKENSLCFALTLKKKLCGRVQSVTPEITQK